MDAPGEGARHPRLQDGGGGGARDRGRGPGSAADRLAGRAPYISVDIDGIDPAYAPATSSLEPGGFTSREIIAGVRLAAAGGFAGFDVVEVAPDFDNPTGATSVLAARLLVEAICCLAADRAGLGPTWQYQPER